MTLFMHSHNQDTHRHRSSQSKYPGVERERESNGTQRPQRPLLRMCVTDQSGATNTHAVQFFIGWGVVAWTRGSVQLSIYRRYITRKRTETRDAQPMNETRFQVRPQPTVEGPQPAVAGHIVQLAKRHLHQSVGKRNGLSLTMDDIQLSDRTEQATMNVVKRHVHR